MHWLKLIADGLTGLRLAFSVAIAVLGPLAGQKELDIAAALLLVAWTTDLLDGPLARKSGKAGQSWLGRGDLLVDMLLAVGLLIFLCASGLAHPLLGLGYLLVWTAILVRYGRLTKPLGAAFQGPVYIWFGFSLLTRRMLVGRIMMLWVLGNVAATWGRLTRRDIPRFFRGLRDLVNNPADRSPEGER